MARLLRARAPRHAPSLEPAWVRPHWSERSPAGATRNADHRRWTVVGNLDSRAGARVDRRGLVAVDGQRWALDWWIGAEDRWHVPAREAAVRQALVGSAPVVETRVRVPGGDAVQRVFAARDAAGGEAIVVEVENQTAVPFALAIAVRPYDLDGAGGVHEVTVAGQVMSVRSGAAVLLPAAPRHAVASDATGDSADLVFAGRAPIATQATASCRDGLAQAVALLPVAHAATVRVVVPLDATVDPATVPGAAQVVSGWQAHTRRGARFELPDRRLQAAVDSTVRHLLLRPGAGSALALVRSGFAPEAARVLLAEIDDLPRAAAPGATLAALAEAWAATDDPAFAARVAPALASLTGTVLRRADDLEQQGSVDAATGLAALDLAADLLDAAGQPRGADDVRRRRRDTVPGADRAAAAGLRVADAWVADAAGRPSAAATLQRARADVAAGSPDAHARLGWALGTASGTWTWPSALSGADTGDGGIGDGHDPAAGAALLLLVRDLLVRDLPGELALAPLIPDAWLGQGWELHDAPTSKGRLSYAVRWHGDRPALLWDLEPRSGVAAVRLTIPGLDPAWSTTDPRGEALLAPVALPLRAPRRGLSIPVSIEPAPGDR